MHNIFKPLLVIFYINAYLFKIMSKINSAKLKTKDEGKAMNTNHINSYGTDLACERQRADLNVPGISYERDESVPFIWERMEISSREGEAAIGRPRGYYDTLTMERMDLLGEEDAEDASNEIAKELCRMFDKCGITPSRILVVGLGNSSLTPDSVGPRTAELINATMHIRYDDSELFRELECSEIAVIIPGVTAKTGLEAADTVSAICDGIEPDAVIAIDSIASRSATRLGTTIQISSTGIFPGSGMGNRRKPIGERTLGIPVIAIGVPTVINSVFFSDENSKNEEHSDMFVAPKDIDAIVTVSAKIISNGINQAFGIL